MVDDKAIQIARPEADRVPATQLVGIALVCASAGVALAYGLASPGAASDAWTPASASSAESSDESAAEDDFSTAHEAETSDDARADEPRRVVGATNEGGRAASGTPSPPKHDAPREWTLLGARVEAPRGANLDPPFRAERARQSGLAAAGRDSFDTSERTQASGGHGGKRGHNARTKGVAVPEEAAAGAVAIHARTVSSDLLNKPLAQRKLQRGPVTYLRCEGAHRNKRSNQCPRDRRLEAGVWKALKDLPKCRVADPGVGRAQLKLTVKKRSEPLIEVAAPETGSGLNLRAVNKCTSPDLVKLKPRLRASQAVITFAFGLN